MLLQPWRIEMLGGLTVRSGDRVLTRFRTQKTASLLAYLAYRLGRSHQRELLIELLWPETDPDAGRHNLRTALSSLRAQLEPPGVAAGTVVVADRFTVCLNSEAVRTDVAELLSCLRAAKRAADTPEERAYLERAVRLYRGDLLEGFYDDWVAPEQRALTALITQARERLAALPHVADGTTAGGPQHATPRPRTSSATRKPTLPVALTRFFGRESEIARIAGFVAPAAASSAPCGMLAPDHPQPPARLVTLTGPGGSGKTRLAIEAARAVASHFEGAVWFVPLADLADAALIPGRIAESMGLRSTATGGRYRQVAAVLERRPSLLVLDNFEQLAEHGGPITARMLAEISTLACIVTSRQILGLQGEQEMPVAPLPAPHAHAAALEELAAVPSVQLFVDRAQKVLPDFQLTSRNAGAVAELCARLEGIPLAIELAAARVALFSPAQMLQQLADRFELLVSRHRDIPERHRTLRAAIEWSYRYLAEELQRLFGRLSVFRGGWTVEAAAIVCMAPADHFERWVSSGLPADTIGRWTEIALEQLAQLRERSLIVPVDSADGARFTMLETLRDFAAQRVPDAESAELRCRHSRYFASIAAAADEAEGGDQLTDAIDRIEAEHDNIRAALSYVVEAEDRRPALRLAASLGSFWAVRGHLTEGRRWAARALDACAALTESREYARVLDVEGRLAAQQDDYEIARRRHTESLQIWRAISDARGTATALQSLGAVLTETGPPEEAVRLCEESLGIWRELGDRRGIAQALEDLACAAWNCSDRSRAARLHEESLEVRRALGDSRAVARSLYRLGAVALHHDRNPVLARSYLEESLLLRRSLSDRPSVAWHLFYLGEVHIALGDHAAAHACLEEARTEFGRMGERGGYAGTLQRLAIARREAGDAAGACTYLDECIACFRAIGVDRVTAAAYADLGLAKLMAGERLAGISYIEEGRRLSRAPEPDLLRVLAALHARDGRDELAAELSGALDTVSAGPACALPPNAWSDALLSAARARLGHERFDGARLRGAAMNADLALEAALAPLRTP